MINLDLGLTVDSLAGLLERFWQVSGEKITKLEVERGPDAGTPVFTVEGQYMRKAGRSGRRGSNLVLPFCSMTPRVIQNFWIAGVRQP